MRNYHGVSLQSGYTYSKSLDVASGNGSDVGIDSYTPQSGLRPSGQRRAAPLHRVTDLAFAWRDGLCGAAGRLEGQRQPEVSDGPSRSTHPGVQIPPGNGIATTALISSEMPADFEFDHNRVNVPVYHPADGTAGNCQSADRRRPTRRATWPRPPRSARHTPDHWPASRHSGAGLRAIRRSFPGHRAPSGICPGACCPARRSSVWTCP